ncbi:DnaD domain protein [Solibacillus isronensis]|uniref:DnaD domain protein n=1 Tax=Solibacillus isronensis TaxID=412383 RepID=UPI00399F2E5C
MTEQEFYNDLLAKREPVKTGIFLLFKGEMIVYVGQAKSLIDVHQTRGKMDYDTYTIYEAPMDKLDHYEQRFINQYQPKYNVILQQEPFNVFDYYQKHVEQRLSGVQRKSMSEWNQRFPGDVLKYAVDLIIERCPDKPFSYLKKLMDTWTEKGLVLLKEIQEFEEQSKPTANTKGANKHAGYERDIEKSGHYKGIAPMGF